MSRINHQEQYSARGDPDTRALQQPRKTHLGTESRPNNHGQPSSKPRARDSRYTQSSTQPSSAESTYSRRAPRFQGRNSRNSMSSASTRSIRHVFTEARNKIATVPTGFTITTKQQRELEEEEDKNNRHWYEIEKQQHELTKRLLDLKKQILTPHATEEDRLTAHSEVMNLVNALTVKVRGLNDDFCAVSRKSLDLGFKAEHFRLVAQELRDTSLGVFDNDENADIWVFDTFEDDHELPQADDNTTANVYQKQNVNDVLGHSRLEVFSTLKQVVAKSPLIESQDGGDGHMMPELNLDKDADGPTSPLFSGQVSDQPPLMRQGTTMTSSSDNSLGPVERKRKPERTKENINAFQTIFSKGSDTGSAGAQSAVSFTSGTYAGHSQGSLAPGSGGSIVQSSALSGSQSPETERSFVTAVESLAEPRDPSSAPGSAIGSVRSEVRESYENDSKNVDWETWFRSLDQPIDPSHPNVGLDFMSEGDTADFRMEYWMESEPSERPAGSPPPSVFGSGSSSASNIMVSKPRAAVSASTSEGRQLLGDETILKDETMEADVADGPRPPSPDVEPVASPAHDKTIVAILEEEEKPKSSTEGTQGDTPTKPIISSAVHDATLEELSISSMVKGQLTPWWDLLHCLWIVFQVIPFYVSASLASRTQSWLRWHILGRTLTWRPPLPGKIRMSLRSVSVIWTHCFLFLTIQVWVASTREREIWMRANGMTRRYLILRAYEDPSIALLPGVDPSLMLGGTAVAAVAMGAWHFMEEVLLPWVVHLLKNARMDAVPVFVRM